MTNPKKILNNIMGDWDNDGVINGLDCQPKNPKKQGVGDIAKKGMSRLQKGLEKQKI